MSDRVLPCVVCAHESVNAINQAIVNGKSRRGIARTFGIGRTDDEGKFHEDHHKITRHLNKCMGEQATAAIQARKVDAGVAILTRMDELDEAVNEVLARARKGTPADPGEDGTPKLNEDGTPVLHYSNHLILAAVVQGRRNADLRARLTGTEPDPDTSSLDRQRLLLESAQARKLLAELEELAAKGDQIIQ